jgi:hypothetical protein
MKILLREYCGKYYVWKDATYNHGSFVCNGEIMRATNILAVKDDNRSNYVVCQHCETVIENTPEAIEAHFAEQEAKRDCFKCSSLRKHNIASKSATFTRITNGTFSIQELYTADLKCGQMWFGSPAIDTDDAKKICIHYRCRRSGVKPIQDIFTKYPDPFDKHITADALNAKKFAYESSVSGYFEYDLKCRNTVKACVNELGIVDHFIIKHRSCVFTAYYSAKYDKLFFAAGRDYEENCPGVISDAKYEQARAKIAALYKEEESK